MPEYVWVKDTDGLEYAVTRDGLDPEIHEEVKGASVVLDANGLPQRDRSADAMPAKNASQEAWAEYATSQGMDPDEAKAANRADLIATYGKEN